MLISLKLAVKTLSKYKLPVFLTLCSSLAFATEKNFFPYILKLIIDAISKGKSQESFFTIKKLILISIGIKCACEILYRIGGYSLAYIKPRFQSNIRSIIFEKILKKKLDYFSERSIGSFSSQIYNLPINLSYALNLTLDLFLPCIFAIFVSAIVISSISIYALLLYLAWAIVHMTISIFLASGCEKRSYTHAQALNLLQGKIIDSVNNIFSIRMFNTKKREESLFKKQQENEICKNKKLLLFSESMKIALGILTLSEFSLVMYLIFISWNKDLITSGDVALIMSVVSNSSFVLWIISLELVNYFQFLGVCERSATIISKDGEIEDQSNKREIKIREGKIEFQNACFSYSKKKTSLKCINIEIKPKETIALVGPSGSGKTTFVRALSGYKNLDSGAIKIDDQDISEVTTESLCKFITFIQQESVLFQRSIKENIAYPKPNATDEEIINAAKLACCDDFIQKLDLKYDSIIGGDNSDIKLSVGQAQRISISRAILNDAKIIVLDEISSALDNITERKIHTAIKNLVKDKTAIIIMHRMALIDIADKIILMNDGQIEAYGTHKELIKSNKFYKELWQEYLLSDSASKDG